MPGHDGRSKIERHMRASLNVVSLIRVLAFTVCVFSMPSASSQQNELAARNKRVMQLYQAGNRAEAISLAEANVTMARSQLGANDKVTGVLLSVLGNLYRDNGRFADAENALKAAVLILERDRGPNPDLAAALTNLGGVYLNQEMFPEAETLFKRALALYDKLPAGPQRNVMRGNGINNLAVLYGMQANIKAQAGRQDEANAAYDNMIAMINEVIPLWSKAFGPTNQNISTLLQNRGEAYAKRNQPDRAEPDLREALSLRQKYLAPGNPTIATTQNSLANVLVAEKKYPEAEALLSSALQIRTAALGPKHPSVARNLDALSRLYTASGEAAKAVEYSKKATAAVIEHASTETLGVRQLQGAGGLVEQRSDYFLLHVANLAVAARGANAASSRDLGNEAMVAAQWAVQSSAAAAVNQLGLRLASGTGAMATLVRQYQDSAALWRDRDKQLIGALSKPEAQQDHAGIQAMRQQIVALEQKMSDAQQKLEKDFPDYVALSSPKPLNVAQAQKLLGPDEAMVFLLPGDKESYVFALTHDGFDWSVIPVGRNDLAAKVTAFRRGLDIAEVTASIAAGKPVLFNLDTAFQLYTLLLGPVELLIKDKRYLAVVPSGSLTALPFHLLVTQKPEDTADLRNFGPYRDAAWLLRRHAVTVLPSVASLKALRTVAQMDPAAKPFIGFGDPLFQNNPVTPPDSNRGPARARAVKVRGYSDYWSPDGIDRSKLADSLPRLEETAEEIKDIAARLGASAADIFLGKDASETTVKRAQLSNYRVVYFATHGLVAGDVKGIGEPALALSIPANPTDADDGLLTSSEVAQLKLNADWVILSACNTMAGDKPGAEALSGLARAFFYAGTRSLLVSHWTVDSKAAMRLTISTFGILADNPSIGRAEAVRRAMLAYLSDTSEDRNAYPSYWAPFSVIGEGAVK
jgi:CHAT domain-containing protein/tetratricopeptide (TPR) repeat protein